MLEEDIANASAVALVNSVAPVEFCASPSVLSDLRLLPITTFHVNPFTELTSTLASSTGSSTVYAYDSNQVLMARHVYVPPSGRQSTLKRLVDTAHPQHPKLRSLHSSYVLSSLFALGRCRRQCMVQASMHAAARSRTPRPYPTARREPLPACTYCTRRIQLRALEHLPNHAPVAMHFMSSRTGSLQLLVPQTLFQGPKNRTL